LSSHLGVYGRFTQTLNRCEALHFTVGTLSTNGAGNIIAHSEAARVIQTDEMIVGMAPSLLGLAARALATHHAPTWR
jgi:hypothetical protein